jgi:hypothetical protein
MSVNQSATTVSSELIGDFLARSNIAVYISHVMGLHCLAIFSPLSLARMIFEHMLAQSDKPAGMSK